jgi:hypothetical protein
MTTDCPETPSITTATDPVHSPEDLRLRWLALMSPLGFGDHTVWMAFLGPDRRMATVLTPLPARSPSDRRRVIKVMAELRAAFGAEFDAGTTVAFLHTRPGSGPVSNTDRRWFSVLSDAAAAHGVPLEPFFRADDDSLVRVLPGS